MTDDAKNGADPLDKENPLRTGNFNKIILYVFLFMIFVMIVAIAFIKLGGRGGGAKPTSAAPSNTRLVIPASSARSA